MAGKKKVEFIRDNPIPAVLVSVEVAAKALGLGRSTTWALVRSGALPSVRIGKRRLIHREQLETYGKGLLGGEDVA